MLLIKDMTLDAWGRRFFDEASATIPTGAKWAWWAATGSASRPCSR